MVIYSEFSHYKKVVFHSYVSLPEGTYFLIVIVHCYLKNYRYFMWNPQSPFNKLESEIFHDIPMKMVLSCYLT